MGVTGKMAVLGGGVPVKRKWKLSKNSAYNPW